MIESRHRQWIWFFLILAALGAAAVFIPLFYNLSLQLTPAQVEAARAEWRDHGPEDYDLDYQQRHSHAGTTEETTYRVLVRNRRVTGVVCDGELTLLVGPAAKLALGLFPTVLADRCGALDMDEMLQQIEQQALDDVSLPRRPYATAAFDKKDGHITRYVRRIRGGERLEWTVKLVRVGASAAQAAASKR